MFDPATCYDVAVFGGGLCGFAAAHALTQKGLSVALIERRPVLGWEVTWAYHLGLGEPTCATARWLREATAVVGGFRDGTLDPTITEMVLNHEAAAAGIDLLFYAQPVAIGRRDDLLTSVLVATKSGEIAVRARAFMDATENALLWRLAGSRAQPPARSQGRHAILFNGVPDVVAGGPVPLGNLPGGLGAILRPTVWPGEAAVEFDVAACDIRPIRRGLPDLIQAVRQRADLPPTALVTSVAAEPYPLAFLHADYPDDEGLHPLVENLFAAGPWQLAGSREQQPLTPADRLAVGEGSAAGAAGIIRALPAPRNGEPPPHSTVAPPTLEADVVVCGGGTAGAFAAIAAARQKARTLLLEAGTCLGGIGTGGGIHCYYHGVPGGLQDEADRRLAALAPLFGPPDKVAGFHPEAKKVVLEQMAAEAGVEIVYNTLITGAQTDPAPSPLPARKGEDAAPARRLRAVVAAGPEGNALYQATAFVDATGDGDVAAMAGAEFTFGRATDGLPHAYSLAAGRLSPEGKLLVTNFDAGYCDPTDAVDMTRARCRALTHYWREQFDPTCRLLYIAPVLGLRNSRQVVGDCRITLADQIAGRQFPDVIAYAYSHFDNHAFDYENESDEAMLWVWLLGNWSRPIGCEVPYRALLPAGVEGLLIGCRALSMTHDAHNQLRMQRDLQRVGEAAGIAAALAALRGITPRELSVEAVQAILLTTGALGPRERRKLPASHTPKQGLGVAPAGADSEETRVPRPNSFGRVGDAAVPVAAPTGELHDTSWLPPQPPALPLAERIGQLGTDKTQEATWDLIRRGDDAVPLLLEALKAAKPAVRFWASVALAMRHCPQATPELRAAVADRRSDLPEGHKAVAVWKSAIVLLGRIGDREAVRTLCTILDDPKADLDVLVATVRALGRIGDPAAVPALARLAARKDLLTERTFQVSVPGASPVTEDARWQVDLAAAEALARLGSPRPDLVALHASDERACVRRYARRVAELSAPLSP